MQKTIKSSNKKGRHALTERLQAHGGAVGRWLSEHTNGLGREHFPKGKNLCYVTDAEIRALQDRLNAQPEKVLENRTLAEAIFDQDAKPR